MSHGQFHMHITEFKDVPGVTEYLIMQAKE